VIIFIHTIYGGHAPDQPIGQESALSTHTSCGILLNDYLETLQVASDEII
jgi:hypothetical protein